MATVSPHASDRVSTAYLKKGRAFYSQQKYDQAQKAFEKVGYSYPPTISVRHPLIPIGHFLVQLRRLDPESALHE